MPTSSSSDRSPSTISTDALYNVLLDLSGQQPDLIAQALAPMDTGLGSTGWAMGLPLIIERIVQARLVGRVPSDMLSGDVYLNSDQRDALAERVGAPLMSTPNLNVPSRVTLGERLDSTPDHGAPTPTKRRPGV